MLILTRRVSEKIIIGKNGEIEITILGNRGNQVRLGIKASKDIPVYRDEIFHKIQEEKIIEEKQDE